MPVRFEPFFGNQAVAAILARMLDSGRIPQTLLLAGPEGTGKATLVRRFAAALLGGAAKIEHDDLSLPHNQQIIADRMKWTSEKRAEDPLLFATHPDFLTFPPEGPLRQIGIQQMRLLRERAQLLPLKGRWRVFLVDQMDRANPQACDSLLKTLEEPPPHLILFLTAQNAFDLPPTIRSRAITFHLGPLGEAEMRAFAASRGLADTERRLVLAAGSPGLAVSLDLALYEKRRALLVALLEAAAGVTPFAQWAAQSESFLQSKSEKLDLYFRTLYGLLEDLLAVHSGCPPVHHHDLAQRLATLAGRISFAWIVAAVRRVDELVALERCNVQKGLSLDALVVSLRGA